MNLYKLTNISWTETDREDIKYVRLARKLGFDVLTSGRFQDGKQVPPDMLTFKDGGLSIWFSVKNAPHYWVAADAKDSYYANYRKYVDLKTALVEESFI